MANVKRMSLEQLYVIKNFGTLNNFYQAGLSFETKRNSFQQV